MYVFRSRLLQLRSRVQMHGLWGKSYRENLLKNLLISIQTDFEVQK
jgi:hypothetical protein